MPDARLRPGRWMRYATAGSLLLPLLPVLLVHLPLEGPSRAVLADAPDPPPGGPSPGPAEQAEGEEATREDAAQSVQPRPVASLAPPGARPAARLWGTVAAALVMALGLVAAVLAARAYVQRP